MLQFDVFQCSTQYKFIKEETVSVSTHHIWQSKYMYERSKGPEFIQQSQEQICLVQ